MPISPEIQSRIERLADELQKGADRQSHDANKSYYSAQTLVFASLGCSVVAAVSGIFFNVPSRIVGAVAALPPLIAYVASSLRLEVRQNWYFRKSVALKALRSQLLYQLPAEPTVENVAAIAAARDKLVTDMQREWYETITKGFLDFKAHADRAK